MVLKVICTGPQGLRGYSYDPGKIAMDLGDTKQVLGVHQGSIKKVKLFIFIIRKI